MCPELGAAILRSTSLRQGASRPTCAVPNLTISPLTISPTRPAPPAGPRGCDGWREGLLRNQGRAFALRNGLPFGPRAAAISVLGQTLVRAWRLSEPRLGP